MNSQLIQQEEKHIISYDKPNSIINRKDLTEKEIDLKIHKRENLNELYTYHTLNQKQIEKVILENIGELNLLYKNQKLDEENINLAIQKREFLKLIQNHQSLTLEQSQELDEILDTQLFYGVENGK